jgi:hypothetical protein
VSWPLLPMRPPDFEEDSVEDWRRYIAEALVRFEARWSMDAPGDDLTIDVLEDLDGALLALDRGDIQTCRWYIAHAVDVNATLEGLDRGLGEADSRLRDARSRGGLRRAEKRAKRRRTWAVEVDAARGRSIGEKVRNVLARKAEWSALEPKDQRRKLAAAVKRYSRERKKNRGQ